MVMNSAVRARPIRAASTEASIASEPRVGPTVRCSATSTGTGSAPPRISTDRSLAWSAVKLPVIVVRPPAIPAWQPTDGSTCGEEITSSSSTIATRRFGSPAGLQAASPVSFCQASPPVPRKSTVTNQPGPCWASVTASEPPTASPVSAAGPICSGLPSSSLVAVLPAAGTAGAATASAPRTGWKRSCAVLPITSAASRGSCTPGSSMMIRRSPERVRVGSLTPSASTRRRSTSSARSVDSASALAVGPSLVSSTIWVPPRRSRPSRTGTSRASASEPATTARATRARSSPTRDRLGRLGFRVEKGSFGRASIRVSGGTGTARGRVGATGQGRG